MKAIARVAIAVVVLVCVLGVVWWVFRGTVPNNAVIGKAEVVGGFAGLLAVVAYLAQWLRAAHRQASAAPATDIQAQTATNYLAKETLRYWQDQAKDRRITTPSPVTIRWCWASDEVAVAARELARQLR